MALEYCHTVLKVIHRDIKPENILINAEDNIKLCDFGVSHMLKSDGNDLLHSNKGTAMFYSPEACIGESYKGKLNDIWACGITLYYMAVGHYPFVASGNNFDKLHHLIQKTEPEYPEALLGTPIHDLITKLLKKLPDERITIAQIKEHPWITKNGEEPMEELVIDDYQEPTQTEKENLITSVYRKGIYNIVKNRKHQDPESGSTNTQNMK